MVWSVSSDKWKTPKGCVHAIPDSFCADRKIIRYSVDRNDTELEQVVHTIVSRGDWLGNSANINVENNWCFRLCWKLPDCAQSFVSCSQIMTE